MTKLTIDGVPLAPGHSCDQPGILPPARYRVRSLPMFRHK